MVRIPEKYYVLRYRNGTAVDLAAGRIPGICEPEREQHYGYAGAPAACSRWVFGETVSKPNPCRNFCRAGNAAKQSGAGQLVECQRSADPCTAGCFPGEGHAPAVFQEGRIEPACGYVFFENHAKGIEPDPALCYSINRYATIKNCGS